MPADQSYFTFAVCEALAQRRGRESDQARTLVQPHVGLAHDRGGCFDSVLAGDFAANVAQLGVTLPLRHPRHAQALIDALARSEVGWISLDAPSRRRRIVRLGRSARPAFAAALASSSEPSSASVAASAKCVKG